MDCFEIRSPRFAHYILSNATLETLATGFRWIEGPVWMGDANCLLFQDLPNDRTMRWIEGQGVSVYRAPSHFANGQTRDRQGRLIACSHRGRCLYRTEYDGHVTTLVDRHAGNTLGEKLGCDLVKGAGIVERTVQHQCKRAGTGARWPQPVRPPPYHPKRAGRRLVISIGTFTKRAT